MKKMHRNILSFAGIAIFLLLAAASSGKKKEGNEKNETLFAEYFQAQEKELASFGEEKQKKREERLAELKGNAIYKAIIVEQIVSAEYLSSLHALGNCIRNAGEESFGLSSDLEKTLGKEEMEFATKTATFLYLGGFTKEMAEAFDRYRTKFKYYGQAGTFHYDANGKETDQVKNDYDLTPIFVILDAQDKKLANAIYEAVEKGISNWGKPEYTLLYPQLSDRTAYNNYLKKVDPDSPYILNYDFELTASELLVAYDENEVAADQKYKGKKILITGKVESIGKDIMDDSYVVLEGDGYFLNVHCTMKDENTAASMKKGRIYTLLGECEGGSVLGGVVMRKCTIEN